MSDIDIGYDLDPSGYLSGVSAIDAANQRLQGSIAGVTTTTAGLSKAYGLITPGRATIAGMALLAQQAAGAQQQLSNLAATSAVTGTRVDKLAGGVRSMARDMPLGRQATLATVEQFTRLGVAADGSERKILALTRTTSKMSGATGEGPQALAQGMTELARATGNTNLDPKRYEALGDSLTTISAKSGASATNILAFSKSIAPMAQSAGIGATGVLGISSAFARLGEDGLGASTAVNKMLADMNRAVREGSPEMKVYAQMAGKSADEFERLFKSNPAEALTQVTESIAKAGPGGPRMLEQLGIEGVRGQRSLQALVASGGLRTAVSDATAAYGNGKTDEAAKAAFGGLNDSVNEAAEAASQLAEAFGAPLLGPLTKLTDVVKGITAGATTVAGSKPVQGALTAAAYGGMALMAMRAIAGPLGVMMLGRQAATSGPGRAAAAGWANARGLDPASSRIARYGAQMTAAERAGTMRQGNFGRARGMMFDRFTGMGMGYNANNPRMQGPVMQDGRFSTGPGAARRFASGFGRYGANLASSYFTILGDQARNARVDPMRRQNVRMASDGFRNAWAAARTPTDGAPAAGRMQAFTTGMSAFHREVQASGAGMRAYTDAARTGARALGQSTMFMGTALKDAAKGIGGVARSMGPQLGMMALIGGGMWAYGRDKEQSEKRGAWMDSDMSGTINAYRESIGKATAATQTYGSQAAQATMNLAAGARGRSFNDTRTVTDEDWANAQQTKGNVVSSYGGTTAQIAAQIQTSTPNGVTSEELQAIKVDLARQLSREQVTDVLKMLPESFEAANKGMGADRFGDLARQASSGAANAEGRGGWSAIAASKLFGDANDMDNLNGRNNAIVKALDFASMAPGGGLHSSTLTDASKAQIESLNQGIGQQYTSQSTKFGANYAEQERSKAINATLKEAYESGNADAFYELSSRAGMQMGGKEMKDVIWSPEELRANDFDFGKMVAEKSKSYASTREQAEAAGAVFQGKGGLTPELLEQQYTKDIRQRSSFLGDVFDVRSKSGAAQAMTSSLESPADVGKQSEAMDAVVDSAMRAGKSMSDLALEAARSATAVGEGTDAWNRIKSIQARAEQEMGARATIGGATASEAQMEQYQYYSKLSEMTPEDSAGQQQKEAAKGQKQAIEAQMSERLRARLQVQRQYEISVTRANEDFNRQQEYAQQDYQTTVMRAERNFGIQRTRSIADFGKSIARAEQDFGISRSRTQRDFNISLLRNEEDFETARMRQVRDFNISAGRAEKDYQKGRFRAFRDFNMALKRQIEDAAKSMLDPYSRIQTKATWDGANLLVNMREQTEAMSKQKDQLDAIRKLGLSTQAIDILGLGKTENAQQLNNLMADATPEMIEQLNAEAKKRAEAAGDLYTDDSNTDLKRQREDFLKSLKDQEEDYRKSVERSRADLARAMSDQRKDFVKALRRSREDLSKSLADSTKDFARNLSRQREDFGLNLRRSRADLNTSMSDMESDQRKSMSRQKKALDTSLSRMAEDIRNADQVIAGNMSELAEQVNSAIHGKAVKWQRILKSDTSAWVTSMQSTVIPQLNKAYAGMGLTVKDVANTSGKSSGGGTSTKGGTTAYADGGRVQGVSAHDRADDVDAKLTAGEWVQPVKAVKHYGNEFMEAVRTLRFPKAEAQRLADGGMVYKQMGAWVKKNLPGVAITSSYRPGAITALGNVSMHAQGKALDLAPSMGTFNKILGTFGKNIHQLFYSPADGRTILRGNPWRMDATTKAGHWDHVHWAMQAMDGMAGGALGMDPAILQAIFAKAPNKAGIQRALTSKAYAALAAKFAAAQTPMSVAGFNGPEDVSRWGSDVAKVLSMLGRPEADAGAVLRRIQFESGGNPRAINLWDSNAKAGIPSKGLMQVIDPTFKAHRSRSLPNNIYDPKANIYAGSHYAIKRYGSLAAIDPKTRPKGYDSGGWMDPGEGEHFNGTAKPEAVLTNEQWTDIHRLADMAASSISADDLRGVNAAAGAQITVNNHQSYAYDQGTRVEGPVTVVSQDPDEMGRKLERKAVEGRLTQTRGVRRNR